MKPNKKIEQFSTLIPQHQRAQDNEYYQKLNRYFETSIGTALDKLHAFPKYVPIVALNRFLAKSKMFEQILTVNGAIVEGGVLQGGGLMTWATLSAILEPLNHTRKVIGFDTFEGSQNISPKDDGQHSIAQTDLNVCSSEEDLNQAIDLFDLFRPLGHIPKVELVKGDATLTIPQYLKANAHLVVALLYLDFDIYEPTKAAIETFLPRMPKGAIIAFDELNLPQWPGETLAVLETLGIRNLRIQRFPFQPHICYAVLD